MIDKNFKKENTDEKNIDSRSVFLENCVEKLMSQHSGKDDSSFNPKLMQANYLLALHYEKEGIKSLAQVYFNVANSEFDKALLEEKRIRIEERSLKNDASFENQNQRLKRLEFYEGKLNAVADKIYSNDFMGLSIAKYRNLMSEFKS